jgi:ABC-type glycerol-3-phosphate transport system substrate-binding protein
MRRRAGLALLGSLALAGCSSPRLPMELFVAIGSNPDQTISADLHDGIREQIAPLQRSFQRLYPDTHIQASLYPEAEMPQTLSQRNAAGLAPDLLYVNGDTALRLLAAGLVTPYPLSAAERRLFNPEDLRRLQTPDGRLAGLPLVLHTQISCFNRTRISTPPATVTALLQASAEGVPIGLNADMAYVLWSVGSLGALPALERAIHGAPLTATDRQAITTWLSWLQEAGTQQRVTVFADQPTAEAALETGHVAWIACRSSALPSLRRRMGARLAVAPLPDGDGHRALDFGRYLVNPLSQRSLTLNAQVLLPANRFVGVPVQSSRTLATLVEAADQGRQSNPLVTLIHTNDPRLPAVNALITSLVFGEVRAPEATPRLLQLLQQAGR